MYLFFDRLNLTRITCTKRRGGGGGGGNRKRHPQAHLKEVKYAYNKKDELRLEVNTAILEQLRKLNNLGPWKQSKHCS